MVYIVFMFMRTLKKYINFYCSNYINVKFRTYICVCVCINAYISSEILQIGNKFDDYINYVKQTNGYFEKNSQNLKKF